MIVPAVFAEHILLAAGQPPEVALASARFCQVNAIGVPLFWAAASVQTICDSLQQTKPGMYAQVTASVLQVGLTALMVIWLRVGYVGQYYYFFIDFD